MYKLKLKEGETVRIKDDRRSKINVTLKNGEDYSQELLEKLYNAGFKRYISKTKPKKDNETESE